MPTLAYQVVDVFTDRAYAGNPLAVVLDADDLSTEQLQAVAREFNLSETAFPLPPTEPGAADYRVRIFTPCRRSCRSPGTRAWVRRGCWRGWAGSAPARCGRSAGPASCRSR